MSPSTDAENWRAVARLMKWVRNSPLVIGLISFSVGGGSGTFIATQKVDHRLDTVMVAIREMGPRVEAIQPLQDTVKTHGARLAKLEDRDARLAYSPPHFVGQGRRRERW